MSRKAFGIVAEFNPFHEGHKYLIEQTSALTKADVCVSAMSGSFVQRGDFAYFDKWERAKEAVKQGVDLVIETPQAYALGSAGYFAYMGVKLLNELDCGFIAFGSETGDVERLKDMSKLEPDLDVLKEALGNGMSYPKAFDLATGGKVSQKPNDILALEYIKTIEKNNYAMEPVSIKRSGKGHHDSASEIREEYRNYAETSSLLSKMEAEFFDILRLRILAEDIEGLDSYEPSGEGLGSKLKKEIRKCSSMEALIASLKSKRYTRTRITRLLYHLILDIPAEMYAPGFMDNICYIRPLAMSEKGSRYLKEIKKKKDIVIVDKVPKSLETMSLHNRKSLELDILAADIYNVARGVDLYKDSDYVMKPTVLR